MESIKRNQTNKWMLLGIALVGLAARLAAATLGHSFDLDSWDIVAGIMAHGGNVYAETTRYNYGPVWFLILHWLDVLSGHDTSVLRYLIASVLGLADVGIFFILCRRFGTLAGILFIFNPVSILITGYHCQFDNLAILLGLWAVLLFGDDFETSLNRKKIAGLLVLGLSLMTKHVLFAFPLWLAVKQKGRWQKIVILLLPVACFLLSFAPYWQAGKGGIMGNVFYYGSTYTSYFYKFFVPQGVQYYWDNETVWYVLLVVFAFICRLKNGLDSLLIYTGVLVAFSPSTTNQYLAIPIALASAFPSWLFALYTAISTFHLCAYAKTGLHLFKDLNGRYDNFAIYMLCCALVWLLWRPQILQAFRVVRREIGLQIGKSK